MPKITYNGKEMEVSEELKKQLDAISEKKVWWEPKVQERYFWGDDRMSIFTNKADDNWLIDSWLAFQTKEEATADYNRRYAIQRVKKWCFDNDNWFVPDWGKSNQEKFEVYFSFDRLKFCVDARRVVKRANEIPFISSEEIAKKLIEECSSDLKIIFWIK